VVKLTRVERVLREILGLAPPEDRVEPGTAVTSQRNAGGAELVRIDPATVSAQQVLDRAGLRMDLDALTELGDAWLHVGHYNRSIEAYTHALGLDPDHFSARFNRGLAAARTERYEEALDDFSRAGGIEPENPAPFANAAAALAKLNRHHEALEYAERAVHLDGENVAALVNLGAVLTRLVRTDEAVKHLEKAVEVDPHAPRAWYDLACAQARLGRGARARRSLEEACRLDPTMAERVNLDDDLSALKVQEMEAPGREDSNEEPPDNVQNSPSPGLPPAVLVLAALGLLFWTVRVRAGELHATITPADHVVKVYAVDRGARSWPKPKFEATRDGDAWVVSGLASGYYDLWIDTDKGVVEGANMKIINEIGEVEVPGEDMPALTERDKKKIADYCMKMKIFENNRRILAIDGHKGRARVLIEKLMTAQTSLPSEEPIVFWRPEVWQFEFMYGGWVKNKRAIVLEREKLTYPMWRQLRYRFDPEIGGIKVADDAPAKITYELPAEWPDDPWKKLEPPGENGDTDL